MIVRYVTGARLDLRSAALALQVRPFQFVAVFVLGGLAIAYLSPIPGLSATGFPIQAAFWTVATTLFLLNYVMAELILVYVGRRLGSSWVPEPLIMLAAIGVTTVILLPLTRGMNIPFVSATDALRLAIANFIWMQILANLHLALVIRDYSRPRGIAAPPRPDPTPERESALQARIPDQLRVVDLCGPRVFEPEILVMIADGHYVEVHTTHRRHLVRASLRTLLERVSPNAGIQISRSVWVSRTAGPSAHKSRKGLWIELKDKHRYEVSRNRQSEVLLWLDGASSGPEPDDAP